MNSYVHVAVTPDGTRVYVTNFGGTVSVIDTATNTVTATLTLGVHPDGVAVTPDGTRAYVINTSGIMSVIDTTSNTVSGIVSLGGQPDSLAISTDGSRIYVSDDASNKAWIVDTATNRIENKILVGGRSIAELRRWVRWSLSPCGLRSPSGHRARS